MPRPSPSHPGPPRSKAVHRLPATTPRQHQPWPDSSSKTSQAPCSAESFHDGPHLFPPRRDRVLVPLRRAAGRDLHAATDPVQQQAHPRQRVLRPEPLPHEIGDPLQPPPLVLIPARRGPASRIASSSATWSGRSLQFAPSAPFEASASRAPAASARRHRFADILLTRSRRTTSRSPAPPSPAHRHLGQPQHPPQQDDARLH